ncbi:MAG TPA: phosphodiester glycosidase family protein [Gaiellaceae bacterium]|nr:phosphodiester glycosidase family protein [Gaiellaceae bacterium]
MLSKLLILAATTAQTLMPGVTYENGVQFTAHGPVAVHVVRAPRPGGLYQVAPLLSNDAVVGGETVTAMQRRLSAQVTAVSVNGDLSSADGQPAGIVVRDGALDHPPVAARSSAGFDALGTLHVDRVRFAGDWRGTGQRRPLAGVNEAPAAGGVVLFTPSWGPTTPRAADAVDAVLSPFPPAGTSGDLAAPVTQLVPGGGTAIPPGGAILQARGGAIAGKLTAEAPVGTQVVTRLILQPSSWAGIPQAVGGGPVLVRNGKVVYRANEAFSDDLLLPRLARSAVGQARDGGVLLVEVDGGRPGYSVGMTNFELALAMQRLGAVWAMALGSGASSGLAFDGALLSRQRGAEQPVADALSVLYYGVYAPPPTAPVYSPNGDGAGDAEQLAYKLVRPANVNAALVGPDGVARVVDTGHRDPGTYRFPFTGADATGLPLPEGAWRWHVDATDDGGAASSAERPFSYDLTLGSLRAAGRTVTARLTRGADVTLRIETAAGAPVDSVVRRAQPAGPLQLRWEGEAPAGRYVARLVAESSVGSSELEAPVTLTH